MHKQSTTFDITGELESPPEKLDDGDLLASVAVVRGSHKDVFEIRATKDAVGHLNIAEPGECIRMRGEFAAEQVESEDGSTRNRLALVANAQTHVYGAPVLDAPGHEATADIHGNAGGDPKSGDTANGKKFTRFSIAANKRTRQEGKTTEETVWHPITAWGDRSAVTIPKLVGKGRHISVKCGIRATDEYGPQLTLLRLWAGPEQTREFDITGVLADAPAKMENGVKASLDVTRMNRDGTPYKVNGEPMVDRFEVFAEGEAAKILEQGQAGDCARVNGLLHQEKCEVNGKESLRTVLRATRNAFLFGEPVTETPHSEATITIAGYAGKDAEKIEMKSGKLLAALSVAVNTGKDTPPMWFRCASFGKNVENVAERSKKGTHLTIEGYLTEGGDYGPDPIARRVWTNAPKTPARERTNEGPRRRGPRVCEKRPSC